MGFTFYLPILNYLPPTALLRFDRAPPAAFVALPAAFDTLPAVALPASVALPAVALPAFDVLAVALSYSLCRQSCYLISQ